MPLFNVLEHDGKRYAELGDNGQPLYQLEGQENPVEYDGENLATSLATTKTNLSNEAAKRRKEIDELKENLKSFEGITDPAAAIAALETVSNLDDSKLIDAGKVDEIKKAAIEAVEQRYEGIIKSKYEPISADRDKYKSLLEREMITTKFTTSKFVAEKLAVPAEMVEATFRSHFTVEDGQAKYRDKDGAEIYSNKNPGELADFDEALEIIVDKYPHKDTILTGANNRGSNNRTNPANGSVNNQNTMTSAEARKLAAENPTLMRERMTGGGDPSKRWQVVDAA